jgi:NAD+ diphosphatase
MPGAITIDHFVPAFRAGVADGTPSLYVALVAGKAVQRSGDDTVFISQSWWQREQVVCEYVIGHCGETAVTAVELKLDQDGTAQLQLVPLFQCLMQYSALEFSVIGRASQVLQWSSDHRFCGRCGAPTQLHARDMARVCGACGHQSFARLAPCIIVLVHDGDRVLLARGRQFPEGMFSTLAGFVEPGETLEQAVAREVCEEVGVRVADIRYIESQDWPFPHQLMVGFWARYDGGEIVLDPAEIAEAAWWPVDALPKIPPTQSISARLIRRYVTSKLAAAEAEAAI